MDRLSFLVSRFNKSVAPTKYWPFYASHQRDSSVCGFPTSSTPGLSKVLVDKSLQWRMSASKHSCLETVDQVSCHLLLLSLL